MARDQKGRFGTWKGGRKNETHHGSMIKIGKEFVRQKGRKSKIGDTVRRKNKNGSYNKGSPWYVRTINGWRLVRKAPTNYKPKRK